jgi:hypothetical protein
VCSHADPLQVAQRFSRWVLLAGLPCCIATASPRRVGLPTHSCVVSLLLCLPAHRQYDCSLHLLLNNCSHYTRGLEAALLLPSVRQHPS